MSKITAVIDIGSNSARMAIFERTSRFGFSLIYETKSKVRISQGCYENGGILQQDAIERALAAISDFVAIAKAHRVRKILCVATSAVRDAPNRAEFLLAAKKRAKLQIKVIDGVKEAFYGAVACSNLLHKKDGITIDIGGGSTECAIIKDGKIVDSISLNLGTIRLKELFFDGKADIKKARKFICDEMEKLPAHFAHSTIFSIGGSSRALAKLIMKKQRYQIDAIHGYEFGVAENLEYFKRIYNSDIKGLRELGIPQDREDNIRQGVLIFAMLLERFGTESIITSGVGVREGVFLSDLLRNQHFVFPKGINPSYRSLMDRFMIEKSTQNAVKKNALSLFNVLCERCGIDRKYLFHLENAAGLTKIGNFLSFYSAHEHSAYFVINALSYGYSHIDRAIISILLKYSSKKIPKDDEILYINRLMPDITTLQWLSFILSVAEVLSVENIIADFSLCGGTLYISKTTYLTAEKITALNRPESISIEFR